MRWYKVQIRVEEAIEEYKRTLAQGQSCLGNASYASWLGSSAEDFLVADKEEGSDNTSSWLIEAVGGGVYNTDLGFGFSTSHEFGSVGYEHTGS